MSDRITSAMVSNAMLRNVESSMGALDRTSEKLSSGDAILEPSENPYGESSAIDLQSTLEGLSSYQANIKEASSLEDTASSALSSIADVIDEVREIVLEGANGSENESDLEDLADEVEQLIESVKEDANVAYGGTYLLSGTATETAPYKTGAEDAYQGNEGSIERAIAPGVTVTIGVSAAELLGEGQEAEDGKLLDVMRTIAENLREGTSTAREALGGADLEGLESNSEALIAMQAHVGAIVDQLDVAESRVEELKTTTSGALANVADVNTDEVTIEYASEQAAYEAALEVTSSIIQMSLLEFLQ